MIHTRFRVALPVVALFCAGVARAEVKMVIRWQGHASERPACDAARPGFVYAIDDATSVTDCDAIGGGTELARCICRNGDWSADVGAQGPQGVQGPPGDPLSACAAWPVGSVFISTSATNPGTSLGCGTWTTFAAGRVLIGSDATQSEFDTAEEIGGAKTHTLTTAELPAHSHNVTDPGHSHVTQRYPTATGGSSGFTIDTSMSGTLADNTLATKGTTTGVTVANTGSDQAFSTLPPYTVVYFWRRAS